MTGWTFTPFVKYVLFLAQTPDDFHSNSYEFISSVLLFRINSTAKTVIFYTENISTPQHVTRNLR